MLTIRYIEDNIDNQVITPSAETEWSGKTVAELAPKDAQAVFVNDDVKIIKSKDPEAWATFVPPDDSVVVFLKSAQGIELAIIVAVAAIAAAASAAAAGAALTTIIIVGLIAGGLTLVQALLAPSASGLPSLGSGGGSASPTYGFDGIRSSIENGAPIPVIYGEHLTGGSIVMAYRYASGNQQELKFLVLLSQGPIHQIGYEGTDDEITGDVDDWTGTMIPPGITLNGIELRSLRGAKVSARMGTSNQTPMPGFSRVIQEYAANTALVSQPQRVVLRWETRDRVNGIRFQISFPSGVWRTDKKGKTLGYGASFNVKIRKLDGTLVRNQNFGYGNRNRNGLFWQIEVSGLETDYYVAELSRNGTAGHEFPPGKKIFVDNANCYAVHEITNVRLAYPNVAMLAVTVRASAQLSGAFPRFACYVKGRPVRSPSVAEWNNVPAWATLDFLRDSRYGLGAMIDGLAIDLDSFQEWADWTEEEVPKWTGAAETEKRCTCNVILDASRGGWDIVQMLATTGRATIVRTGETIRVKIERASVPVQMFGAGNIVAGSFRTMWDDPNERVNVVEVRYLDAASDYGDSVATAETPGLDPATRRPKTIDLIGVTSTTQARRYAFYLLRHLQMTRNRIEFQAGIDAIACEPGDVIKVSDDSVGFSFSGRLLSANASATSLDRPVTLKANRLYIYEERADDLSLVQQTFVVTTEGDYTNLPFAPPSGFANAQGRVWTIRPAATERHLYFVTNIRAQGDGFIRTIEALFFDERVFGDDAEPIDPTPYEPPTPDPADPVTGLAVTETAEEDGISILTVTWTAAANGLVYRVWMRVIDNGNSLDLYAEAEGATTAILQTDAPLGATMEIVVQTVTAQGAETALGSSPSIRYTITREDEGTDLVAFPGPVTNLAQTPGSGTSVTLSWTAATGTPDGYEVRLGAFPAGSTVYDGAGTSAVVRACGVEQRFVVRARKGGYYSADARAIKVPAESLAGYATVAAEGLFDFRFGTQLNIAIALWTNAGTGSFALRQNYPEEPCSYTTEAIDLSTSAATRISVAPAVIPWIEDSVGAQPLYGSMSHRGLIGDIAANLITWRWFLETSADGTTWAEEDITALLGTADIVRTSRYFRFRFEADPILDEETSAKVFLLPTNYRLERA